MVSTSTSITEIPLDRFILPVPDSFTCAKCNRVPKDTKQSLCGHLFCNRCITGPLLPIVAPKQGKKRKSAVVQFECPTCSVQIQSSQIIDPPWVLLNAIKGLKVKCAFAEGGCDNQTLTVETIGEHEKVCVHGPAQCENANCPLSESGVLQRMHAASHKTECEWRSVLCPHGCKRQMLARDVQQHTCAQKPVQCSAGCGLAVKQNRITQHQSDECSKTVVKCSVQGCEFGAERGSSNVWDRHMRDECAAHHNLPIQLVGQLSDTVKTQQTTIQNLQQAIARMEQQIPHLTASHQSPLDSQQQQTRAQGVKTRLNEMQRQVDNQGSMIGSIQKSNEERNRTLHQHCDRQLISEAAVKDLQTKVHQQQQQQHLLDLRRRCQHCR
eukprot:c5660_g1_i1.p1 GENE.c5660_g1_i1~~c5660_g1_i1.p1  ORF type:complete len:382 (+),score=96.29 c5660_g1_i1:87-1232(+)